jgi:hypothetical protein
LPDWKSLVQHIARSENPGNLIAFEPYGGAISKPNPNSSFPHRDQKLNMKVNSYYRADWPYNKTRASAQKWLDAAGYILRPALSGRVYVNYMREGLANYQRAYWGDSFEDLLKVKELYDPQQFFRSPQPLSR